MPTDLYPRIVALRNARIPFAVCTVVHTTGSSPRKAGARMLVLADGNCEGTIGGGAIEHTIIQEAIQSLTDTTHKLIKRHLTHELAMCCGGGMTVFIEPQIYPARLYMFGCGHVGRPLARMAAMCGFDVTAIDHRAEFADPKLFAPMEGNLTVQCAVPTDIIETLEWNARDTFVAIATHDHDLDEQIVDALLGRPLTWLGCIGSQRKALKFRQRLKIKGWTDTDIDRMRTPMGLDIQAQTPGEIAVSTLAEIIATHRQPKTPNSEEP